MDLFSVGGYVLGIVSVLGIGIATLFWKNYLTSYLSRKAENLATKEDIARITAITEKIRVDSELILEKFKETSQLRLAALERRLEAHQQAYRRWGDMLDAIHSPKLPDVINEGLTWWKSNCLYLSPTARKAFSEAWWRGRAHRNAIDMWQTTTDPREKEIARRKIDENWTEIRRAGDHIVQSVDLPPISGGEMKALSDPNATESSTAPT